MANTPKPTKPPAKARDTFTALAKLALQMKPESHGQEVSALFTAAADKLGPDLTLSMADAADALAACAARYGVEGRPTQHRRADAGILAEMAAKTCEGKHIAGVKPPSSAALAVWSALAKAFPAGPYQRELVEMSGRAAIRVIGTGPAKVTASNGLVTGFLANVEPDQQGQITLTHVHVRDSSYQLPVPITVSKQAALHRVGHPWAALGLALGDVGHDHPVPPVEKQPEKPAAKPAPSRPAVTP